MTDDVTSPPVRVCDCTSLEFGNVVHDDTGTPWVFVGYTTRTTGRCAEFVRTVEGMTAVLAKPWQYSVDFAPTMLAKFPDALRYVTGPTTRSNK